MKWNWLQRQRTLSRMIAEASALEPKSDPESEPRFRVPVSWVASTALHPDVNLGDALSAIIVSTMAGRPIRHANFDENCERVVAVGTIGHAQRSGRLHFWGTGVDATRNPLGVSEKQYIRPPDTEFHVHALRGKFSALTFRQNGIAAPEVYGDPVWFLPRIFPRQIGRQAELGVVVHITELEEQRAGARLREELLRYRLPESLRDSVKLINTFTAPCLSELHRKVDEITSCKCILSTSLHGLVIAETYGIPCAWFATFEGGGQELPLDATEGERIDHRVRDFYSGLGASVARAYCQPRDAVTDWDAALRFLHSGRAEHQYNSRPLFDAFPLPLAVDYSDDAWPVVGDRVTRL